ncbi:hypothetical protein [Paragemmobacter straminiformis]|uniref:Uncharacterized protein n=1 Tax=Paragemmobacter straminiformis TaxID=2045119 RepID=A0A842I4P7_9RHOB|nr:hypothetical protein [Gemmobacter straminiformis]MBC2834626.1 hypothetical protein [Gemmobacter straminiformis]
MRLLASLLLAATALAPSAGAETQATPAPAATEAAAGPGDANAGAVSQFMAAQDLFALGRARKDPLAVLAAARLAATIVATDTDRLPDPAGEAVPPSHPDSGTMFTAAKALAAEDEALVDLVARSAAEAARLPARSLIRSTRGIAAGAAQVYTLPFFGGSVAEVGLLGDGKANLDLAVALDKKTALCLDTGPEGRALCTFALTDNAEVTVTVTNRSDRDASYSLLTN